MYKNSLFLCVVLMGSYLNALDFPVHPAVPMLSIYIDDNEQRNCITIDSCEVHWRDKYRKIGIRYFSEAELEKLKISVNKEGFLTYNGAYLPAGSYAYVLSQEGNLFAFARKDAAEKRRNEELVRCFKKNETPFLKHGPLFRKIVLKHSSLSLGKDLLAAGDFEIDSEGRVSFFSNDSGHYRLKSIYMKNLAIYLHSAGIHDAVFHLYYKDRLHRERSKVTHLSDVLAAPITSSVFTTP